MMNDEKQDLMEQQDLSLLETLDHALTRGLVISGNVTISVADIDLIFLGLNLILGSVDTIEQSTREQSTREGLPGKDRS